MGESAAQRKAREMREQRADKKRKKERRIEQRFALHVKRYKAAGVERREQEDLAEVERVLVVLSTVVTQCVRAQNCLFAELVLASTVLPTLWILRTPGLTRKDTKLVPLAERPPHCFLGWSANPKPTPCGCL